MRYDYSMNNRIQQVRQHTNLSQKDFAALTGISAATLSQILSGKQAPTIKTIEAIHSALPEISLDWLMFGKGEMLQADQVAEGSQPEGTSAHAEVSQRFERESNIGGMQATLFAPYDDQRRRNENPAKANPSDDGKKADKRQRYITEIRVFYSDGTFESFAGNKQP